MKQEGKGSIASACNSRLRHPIKKTAHLLLHFCIRECHPELDLTTKTVDQKLAESCLANFTT